MNISLSTEITDRRQRAVRGWVLYDETCELCQKSVAYWRRVVERRGFAFAALQEPWVRVRLGLNETELLREMRLLLPDGEILGGADAILRLARAIWWAWPLVTMAWVPGVKRLLRAGYRAVAVRRSCVGEACAVGTAASTQTSSRKTA
jgi:predicted DCC family thiol-disulfide oxidoreductase YuxK